MERNGHIVGDYATGKKSFHFKDMDADKYSTFSRKLDDTVNLSKEDCLIVIGEK